MARSPVNEQPFDQVDDVPVEAFKALAMAEGVVTEWFFMKKCWKGRVVFQATSKPQPLRMKNSCRARLPGQMGAIDNFIS